MNEFLRKGIEEYKKRIAASERFDVDCARIKQLVESSGLASDEFFILLLSPLIEVAWVDGRLGRYEQDAILKAAGKYDLLSDEQNFVILMDRMTTRPISTEIEGWWDQIAKPLRTLPLSVTAAISSHLLEQARYIAGLGQKAIFGLWRGHSAGADENEAISVTKKRLNEIESSATGRSGELADDHLKLLPLVDVAWADGRITKRERKLIFDSFFDLGIKPTNDNIQRLLSWLKLNPKQDFVQASLQKLRQKFESMPPDERAKEKYSLISQCTLIAEASGGTKQFPAGGNRICDDEIVAVKKIASILNGALENDKPRRAKGGIGK